jgi:hypothetical protein
MVFYFENFPKPWTKEKKHIEIIMWTPWELHVNIVGNKNKNKNRHYLDKWHPDQTLKKVTTKSKKHPTMFGTFFFTIYSILL